MSATRTHRILVVDDSATNTLMMAEALSRHHTILVATTAGQAIRIAGRSPHPDLILLDLQMPDTDGIEACKLLKGDEQTSGIPVILVTAGGSESAEQAGFTAGAVDFIRRPISTALLNARVRLHLRLADQAKTLRLASLVDPLTGLQNRRRFDSEVALQWGRSAALSAPLSVIMIDIDYFKNYNDALGHGEGDRALKLVAEALTGALSRTGDLLVRWGGEEFAVMLPDTDAQGATAVAERMLAAVRSLALPHPESQCGTTLTVSAGVADTPAPTHMPMAELVAAADLQLYRAKAAGRDQVAWRDS